MNGRLTFAEFDFLKKILLCIEQTGDAWVQNDSGKEFSAKLDLFTASRQRMIETTNKVRLLREKIENIAGQ